MQSSLHIQCFLSHFPWMNKCYLYSVNHPMASHPLISTVVTLYTLILLYFTTLIAFSPVLISTSLLLLSLLRLGAAQRISQQKPEPGNPSLQLSGDFTYPDDCSNSVKDSVDRKPHPYSDPTLFEDGCFVESACQKVLVTDPDTKPFYGECFVEWNVRAPLEVIYEAYEGEEEGESAEEKREEELRVIERYASLSMYYPETDTDSSSGDDSPVIGNWESPDNVCFRWDEDEDREELIEIELDCNRNSEVEEENLIEIDLTPANFPATRKMLE